MNRLALLLIASAGLAYAAGQPVLPTDSRRSEPGPAIILSEGPPVETPLVEKLLPKSPQVAETRQNSPQLVDGQLSPRGEWRWSEADWKWLPVKQPVVKQPGPMWNQDGHGATVEHLMSTHGYSRAELAGRSQRELDILHSNSHNAASRGATRRPAASSSACPNGQCGDPVRFRGLLGRRR